MTVSGRKPGTPAFMQLKNLLRQGILKGQLTGKLPSERDLALTHDIAYMTARRAVDALAEEGLIHRVHGRGTFVAHADGGFHRTGNLGVVVACGVKDGLANPYYAQVLAGVLDAATAGGSALVVARVGEALVPPSGNKSGKRKIDGAIVLGHDPASVPALQHAATFVPVALVNADSIGARSQSLRPENAHGARELARHVQSLGHVRVAFITGGESVSSMERLAGVREYFPEIVVTAGDFEIGSGRAAAKRLLRSKHPLTAIIAANDMMAFGVLGILAELGRTPGRDLSVAGFDDLPFAAYMPVPLTSVGCDLQAIGRAAVEAINSRLAGDDIPAQRRFPTTLRVRSSTGPV